LFHFNGKELSMQSFRKSKSLGMILLIYVLWLPERAFCATETVFLPVTLEYPFIRSVLADQLYKAPGERAIVIDEQQQDCVHMELSNPEVSREHSLIKVGSNIRIRVGVPILDSCMGMIEWQGYIEVLQRPVLDEESWQARFETIDSRIYNTNRKPATVAGRIWNLIKLYVHPYLNKTIISLVPPLEEMKDFLPLAFPPEERRHVHRWLDTLRPGPVQVEESAVTVILLLEVPITSKPPAPSKQLSPSEIEHISRTWEDWDAFLVFEIESLIGQSITDAERAILMEILLENRHEFLQALSRNAIGTDLVRQQFIWTWQRLAQILRKYLVNQKSRPSFSYLAFFAASDALVALDKLGPTVGMEISRDGLIRLARLLSTNVTDPILSYSYSLDPELRKFLGLGPPLDDSGPSSDIQELELPRDPEKNAMPDDIQSWLGHFLFPQAWARERIPTLLDQVRQWIPPTKDPELYVGKVRNLLKEAGNKMLTAIPLTGDYHSFFHPLVLATAWQESCWRQFIARDGKLRYLVSYNQSSVGLMQINERVWRGIYRVESLRWNISYNVKAGIEILHLYLRSFALKEIKPANPDDLDTIAQVTYAMYNGGPGQLKEYLKRSNTNRLYRSDQFFWEKYTAAKGAKFDQQALCLSGK
jgi:hypothetical protein